MQSKTFVHQLHSILEQNDLHELIRWYDENNGTFMLKPYDKNFPSLVLKRYFKHGNISSFVRQLHMYGFHKVSLPNSNQPHQNPNDNSNHLNNEEETKNENKTTTNECTSNNANDNVSDKGPKSKKADAKWYFVHPSGFFYKDADQATLNKIQRKTTGVDKDGKRRNILATVRYNYINQPVNYSNSTRASDPYIYQHNNPNIPINFNVRHSDGNPNVQLNQQLRTSQYQQPQPQPQPQHQMHLSNIHPVSIVPINSYTNNIIPNSNTNDNNTSININNHTNHINPQLHYSDDSAKLPLLHPQLYTATTTTTTRKQSVPAPNNFSNQPLFPKDYNSYQAFQHWNQQYQPFTGGTPNSITPSNVDSSASTSNIKSLQNVSPHDSSQSSVSSLANSHSNFPGISQTQLPCSQHDPSPFNKNNLANDNINSKNPIDKFFLLKSNIQNLLQSTILITNILDKINSPGIIGSPSISAKTDYNKDINNDDKNNHVNTEVKKDKVGGADENEVKKLEINSLFVDLLKLKEKIVKDNEQLLNVL